MSELSCTLQQMSSSPGFCVFLQDENIEYWTRISWLSINCMYYCTVFLSNGSICLHWVALTDMKWDMLFHISVSICHDQTRFFFVMDKPAYCLVFVSLIIELWAYCRTYPHYFCFRQTLIETKINKHLLIFYLVVFESLLSFRSTSKHQMCSNRRLKLFDTTWLV